MATARRRRKLLASGTVFGISFLAGWLVTHIWGEATLLAVLLILGVVAAFLRRNGVRKARKAESWLLDQFWGEIRMMFLGALMPTAWGVLKQLYIAVTRSGDLLQPVVELLILIFVGVVIWKAFQRVPKRL